MNSGGNLRYVIKPIPDFEHYSLNTYACLL
jgi:hypothetical protein